MLMAEENTENWLGSGDLCEGFEDLDKFSIDIESLYEILSEESEGPTQNHSQSSPEELSCRNTFDGEATLSEINHGSSQSQNGVQIYDAPQVEGGLAGSSACCPEELEVTDARSEMASECMFEFPVNSGMVFDNMNMDSACHFDSPLHTCSVSLGDWSTSYVENDTCSSRENHFYNAENTTINQIPNCGFKFTAGDTTHASGSIYHENIVHLKVDDGNDFKRVEGDYHSKCASHFPTTRGSCSTFEDDNAMIGRSTEDLVGPVRNLPTSNMDITFSYAETPLQNALPSEINDNQAYDSNECSMGSFSECFDTVTDSENLADSSGKFSPCRFEFPFFESEEGNMGARVELELLPSESMCTNSRTDLEAQAVASISVVPDSPLMVHTETKNCQDSLTRPSTSYCSTTRGKASYNAHGNKPVNASNQLVSGLHSFISSKDLVTREDKRVDKLHASESVSSQSENIANDAFEGYHSAVSKSSVFSDEFGPFVDHSLSYLVPDSRSLMSSKRLKIYVKDEKKDKVIPPRSIGFQSAKFSGQVIKSSSSVYSYQLDDDPDICILEDISDPRHPKPAVGNGKSLVISNHSSSDLYLTGSAGTRLFNTNDERLTYRVALQDLSQPTVEATPPNGVLAVPLMRHQRIALSWMVQKETSSLQCSGGILADDQGLGKTISTIALILKERPPSKMSLMTVKQDDTKALNLDDDDDDTGVCQLDRIKQEDGESDHKSVNKCSVKSENASILSKGRPSAGTLIVCPTSVLRQWAEELHNKVTKEANLSVLVYHGSNRTKDPLELVKYDVVVTTYSIVSMEVPKQPLGDKDDDERVKSEEHVLSPTELSCKKRKYPPSSTKKSKKDKKGTDSSLLDSAARPLARVGWFRVVLDEAQSIKNHRTQVARACWGLRAKRRWCLSGTPIQNAVDDLYSYFRFLRYDPYAVYKSFCSMIKVPITRNPTTGYKKLQAVLKTIMLRRTKGTKIDGEPIICLPPKSVELKKVDFSLEEREFYSKLEADSRAQFNVYAAAGTVQQNYVNILLMLLRLRQACDHPFLVKGYDSTSLWSSSLEMAKKLPKEKQTNLLSCLEACLAICGICNDSPEEAVVTICGHVFCNQCISEHLTGDDNLCPATQCKVHLNATSVFSSATLKSSLFDQSQHDMCAPQIDEALDSCSEGFYSSKIRAALEVLESLSKPESCNPRLSCLKSSNEVARFPGAGNMCDAYAGDTVDKRIVNIENGFDSSSTKKAEKAIVFSQWTRMLDLLEARLKTSSIQYRRLDGTMSVVARDKAVKDFNTLPEVTVMIMSLKAASLGLNMVAACHVLLLDLWWNPTTEDQAIDRAHRIGQTRPVTVLRLTVKDTVEDRILALQQKKREMVASAFGEDETGSRQTRLTVDDLRYLFTGADH